MAARCLADQGAEVIKVEPPQGDNLRKYPSTLAAEGRAFIGVNRGKLGHRPGPEASRKACGVLLRLVREADVLVHNFRPIGAGAPRHRLRGAETINPRLIYCAVTGYGESGPLKDKAGYDQVLQSMTGICAMQGTRDEPHIVYGSVVDYYAAALLAGSVLVGALRAGAHGAGPVRRRFADAQRAGDAVCAAGVGRG